MISAEGKLEAIPTHSASAGPNAVVPPVDNLPTLAFRSLQETEIITLKVKYVQYRALNIFYKLQTCISEVNKYVKKSLNMLIFLFLFCYYI